MALQLTSATPIDEAGHPADSHAPYWGGSGMGFPHMRVCERMEEALQSDSGEVIAKIEELVKDESVDVRERLTIARALVDWYALNDQATDCLRVARIATEIGMDNLGPLDEDVLIARNSELYWQATLGKYHNIDKNYRILIRDVEHVIGNHSELAWAVRTNSAMPAKARGDFTKAVSIYRRVVRDMGTSLAEDDSLAMSAQDNLAEALVLADKYDSALKIYRSLHGISKKKWGLQDGRTLRLRGEIARTKFLLGRRKQAMKEWKQTFTDCLEVLGAHNPLTLEIHYVLLAASIDMDDSQAVIDLSEMLVNDPPEELEEEEIESFRQIIESYRQIAVMEGEE